MGAYRILRNLAAAHLAVTASASASASCDDNVLKIENEWFDRFQAFKLGTCVRVVAYSLLSY
jgi:hypothetical protein